MTKLTLKTNRSTPISNDGANDLMDMYEDESLADGGTTIAGRMRTATSTCADDDLVITVDVAVICQSELLVERARGQGGTIGARRRGMLPRRPTCAFRAQPTALLLLWMVLSTLAAMATADAASAAEPAPAPFALIRFSNTSKFGSAVLEGNRIASDRRKSRGVLETETTTTTTTTTATTTTKMAVAGINYLEAYKTTLTSTAVGNLVVVVVGDGPTSSDDRDSRAASSSHVAMYTSDAVSRIQDGDRGALRAGHTIKRSRMKMDGQRPRRRRKRRRILQQQRHSRRRRRRRRRRLRSGPGWSEIAKQRGEKKSGDASKNESKSGKGRGSKSKANSGSKKERGGGGKKEEFVRNRRRRHKTRHSNSKEKNKGASRSKNRSKSKSPSRVRESQESDDDDSNDDDRSDDGDPEELGGTDGGGSGDGSGSGGNSDDEPGFDSENDDMSDSNNGGGGGRPAPGPTPPPASDPSPSPDTATTTIATAANNDKGDTTSTTLSTIATSAADGTTTAAPGMATADATTTISNTKTTAYTTTTMTPTGTRTNSTIATAPPPVAGDGGQGGTSGVGDVGDGGGDGEEGGDGGGGGGEGGDEGGRGGIDDETDGDLFESDDSAAPGEGQPIGSDGVGDAGADADPLYVDFAFEILASGAGGPPSSSDILGERGNSIKLELEAGLKLFVRDVIEGIDSETGGADDGANGGGGGGGGGRGEGGVGGDVLGTAERRRQLLRGSTIRERTAASKRRRRFLTLSYRDEYPPAVSNVEPLDCPNGVSRSGSCHLISAWAAVVATDDEDPDSVRATFLADILDGIRTGKLDAAVRNANPGGTDVEYVIPAPEGVAGVADGGGISDEGDGEGSEEGGNNPISTHDEGDSSNGAGPLAIAAAVCITTACVALMGSCTICIVRRRRGESFFPFKKRIDDLESSSSSDGDPGPGGRSKPDDTNGSKSMTGAIGAEEEPLWLRGNKGEEGHVETAEVEVEAAAVSASASTSEVTKLRSRDVDSAICTTDEDEWEEEGGDLARYYQVEYLATIIEGESEHDLTTSGDEDGRYEDRKNPSLVEIDASGEEDAAQKVKDLRESLAEMKDLYSSDSLWDSHHRHLAAKDEGEESAKTNEHEGEELYSGHQFDQQESREADETSQCVEVRNREDDFQEEEHNVGYQSQQRSETFQDSGDFEEQDHAHQEEQRSKHHDQNREAQDNEYGFQDQEGSDDQYEQWESDESGDVAYYHEFVDEKQEYHREQHDKCQNQPWEAQENEEEAQLQEGWSSKKEFYGEHVDTNLEQQLTLPKSEEAAQYQEGSDKEREYYGEQDDECHGQQWETQENERGMQRQEVDRGDQGYLSENYDESQSQQSKSHGNKGTTYHRCDCYQEQEYHEEQHNHFQDQQRNARGNEENAQQKEEIDEDHECLLGQVDEFQELKLKSHEIEETTYCREDCGQEQGNYGEQNDELQDQQWESPKNKEKAQHRECWDQDKGYYGEKDEKYHDQHILTHGNENSAHYQEDVDQEREYHGEQDDERIDLPCAVKEKEEEAMYREDWDRELEHHEEQHDEHQGHRLELNEMEEGIHYDEIWDQDHEHIEEHGKVQCKQYGDQEQISNKSDSEIIGKCLISDSRRGFDDEQRYCSDGAYQDEYAHAVDQIMSGDVQGNDVIEADAIVHPLLPSILLPMPLDDTGQILPVDASDSADGNEWPYFGEEEALNATRNSLTNQEIHRYQTISTGNDKSSTIEGESAPDECQEVKKAGSVRLFDEQGITVASEKHETIPLAALATAAALAIFNDSDECESADDSEYNRTHSVKSAPEKTPEAVSVSDEFVSASSESDGGQSDVSSRTEPGKGDASRYKKFDQHMFDESAVTKEDPSESLRAALGAGCHRVGQEESSLIDNASLTPPNLPQDVMVIEKERHMVESLSQVDSNQEQESKGGEGIKSGRGYVLTLDKKSIGRASDGVDAAAMSSSEAPSPPGEYIDKSSQRGAVVVIEENMVEKGVLVEELKNDVLVAGLDMTEHPIESVMSGCTEGEGSSLGLASMSTARQTMEEEELCQSVEKNEHPDILKAVETSPDDKAILFQETEYSEDSGAPSREDAKKLCFEINNEDCSTWTPEGIHRHLHKIVSAVENSQNENVNTNAEYNFRYKELSPLHLTETGIEDSMKTSSRMLDFIGVHECDEESDVNDDGPHQTEAKPHVSFDDNLDTLVKPMSSVLADHSDDAYEEVNGRSTDESIEKETASDIVCRLAGVAPHLIFASAVKTSVGASDNELPSAPSKECAAATGTSGSASDDISNLISDIVRTGIPEKPWCTFGDLCNDEEVQKRYDSLAGSLINAKEERILTYMGQMLFKGVHDDVRIELLNEDEFGVVDVSESLKIAEGEIMNAIEQPHRNEAKIEEDRTRLKSGGALKETIEVDEKNRSSPSLTFGVEPGNEEGTSMETPPTDRAKTACLSDAVADEIARLMTDITRIGTPGEPWCTFGDLFDDGEVQQRYEALVGTLKSAKKKGVVNFRGQMLLKGVHDNVRIEIADKLDEKDETDVVRGFNISGEAPKVDRIENMYEKATSAERIKKHRQQASSCSSDGKVALISTIGDDENGISKDERYLERKMLHPSLANLKSMSKPPISEEDTAMTEQSPTENEDEQAKKHSQNVFAAKVTSSSCTASASQDATDEIAHLITDITRVSIPGEPWCTFGDLFDDDEVQQRYEALVGTLKSARKKGLITFKGQMLLKGVHDKTRIEVANREGVKKTKQGDDNFDLQGSSSQEVEKATLSSVKLWRRNVHKDECDSTVDKLTRTGGTDGRMRRLEHANTSSLNSVARAEQVDSVIASIEASLVALGSSHSEVSDCDDVTSDSGIKPNQNKI